ncbi:MAG: sugar ABC transporter substrate-binding protein [Chloroflexota bacterium]|nr:sugar ABC transporter substrate-binding protein [Chloroflexota bacterium]
MKPRIWHLLALLLIISMVAAACAVPASTPAPAPQPEAEKPAPAETVTVRIATWAGVDESAELQEVIEEVNASVDHFQIVHEPAPDDYYTKIQTSLAGGTSADLFWLSQEWIAGLADQGGLLDVTDYLEADDQNPAADLDDYFDDILKTARFKGQYYGLPWIAQPVVMFFNRALFDEAGVDYPTLDWTWDNFLAASEALTQDTDGDGSNDQWGFTLTGWPPPQMFIWQAGGEIISDDLSESPVDSPEAIAGLDFYANMIYDDVHAPPEAVIQEQGFGEMFKAGKVAMFMGGAADDLDRVEGLDVGVVAVPAGPAGRPTFAWTASTVVAADTEYPEITYEALARLTDGIHHWKIVAPRKSLATAEGITASEPRKEANAEAIAAAVPSMRAFNIIPRHQEWDTIFWGDFMDPLFHGEGTAEELAPEIRPLLEEMLPEGGAAALAPEEPAEKVTVRIATWAGVEESSELQEVINAVNAEATTYQIVHEPAPDDYYTKIQTSLAGGTSADLFWLSQEWIAGLADQGGLLDVTDYLEADDQNPAADLDDYFDDILKTARFKGQYYGLPWIAQPVVMFFNRALFDEAGVDYPTLDWTWDNFLAASEALTQDTDGDGSNDQWGFTLTGWPPPQMFIWQAGGEIISDDLSESPVDSPEAIAGLDFYANMIYDDVHAPPEAVIQEQGFGEMFKAGKVAMFMGGAADDLDRVEGLDVGVVAVPAGPAGRPTFAWTASTVVAADTEYPEITYEALARLTDGIHHWKIVAPRKSLATAEGITASEPRKEANAEAIAAAVPSMRAFNIIPRHQEWDTIFWGDFMDLLFHGEGTAEELAPEIRPLLEEMLP